MATSPRFSRVVFDCDSTLSAIEGIDELCRALPPDGSRLVASWTEAAMNGDVGLADVYARRLDLVRPSRSALEELGRRYVDRLVPGAREVVRSLVDAGVDVHVVSGGLALAVEALARALDLPPEAVHAVAVVFDQGGAYVDYDRASPLARGGGKVEVLAALRRERSPLLFVGDGVTDLEAQGVVDRFVGYGGVIRRAAVQRGAERYVEDPDLHWVLDEVFPASPHGD